MTDDAPKAGRPIVAEALRDARIEVLSRWELRESRGHDTGEELLTSLLLDAAEPVVHYVEFNRREEGVVGADWLWWFIDEDGTCFGLLVQAKKLKGRPGPGPSTSDTPTELGSS